MTRVESISPEANKTNIASIAPGVTLVTEHLARFFSFSLGFFINFGSRDESTYDNGMVHLLEHMLFKGTTNRSSLDIVKLIEGLGGSFDAYTTKENLIIVTKFLSEHFTRIFDLIAELLFESRIAPKELKKEKSVILEEIKTNIEDPADYVFDIFFRALYGNHPMARPIAGTVKSVSSYDAARTKFYYKRLKQQPIVIALSGDFNYKEVYRLTKKTFSRHVLEKRKRLAPTGRYGQVKVHRKKESAQVHVVLGSTGVDFLSPQRYRLSLLNMAFGGGMSSRLFQGLRERHGLVYNVQSFIDLYSDCGITGFYFTCDKKNLRKVAEQVKEIIRKINNTGFTKDEIELAKTYLSGNLLLSFESSTNRMLRMGREMTYLNTVTPITKIITNIKCVKATEVNDLNHKYLDLNKYVIAAVGPVSQREIEDLFRS
ncbi:hypothetical protein A2Y85_06300 [candidate division WOR-3 bacterium RBG_13_43_14]|uniref:Peptidase M16 n=1 Tax=candidate division WOR-3 bacterium RBG_13_43_14 TaxID=1802590 RepID=A0A1F4U3B7_UNCW3|nr:MAG: hypothetical protein A2Y85_06300 [candidate division WOR-3 bacterium RBG_13_43_14]